jgi:DNA adenine methylase
MAPWILEHLPADHDVYVEPYGGSAAVLLRKERSHIEVYNDLDSDVVNFFRMIRERPDDLMQAIYWTPFAHAEQQLSLQPCDDPLERARRLYVRSQLTINGPTAQWNSGWRRQKVFSRGRSGESMMKTAARSFTEVDHLYQVAERLRGVTIESENALTLIGRYDQPRTVFYVDPPYVLSTRVRLSGGSYQHEMTDDQHRELADVLHGCDGMVLLSGYESDLYDELYGDWRCYQRSVRTNGNNGRMASELLWLNPAAAIALERQNYPLFHQEVS